MPRPTPRLAGPLLALLASLPASAIAQQAAVSSQWGTPRIDPSAAMVFAHLRRFHETIPVFRRSARLEREATLPVVIRFRAAPSPAVLNALAAQGVRVGHGGVALASGAYIARVDEAALGALEREVSVARVEVDLPRNGPRPLDVSARETAIEPSRRALRMRDGTELDGHGTVIADIDASLFVFHPALFRDDGGVYPWIDVNGDHVFTPGVNAVDLDRDGAAGPDETLALLAASAYQRDGTSIGPRATSFRPAYDWLFVDTDHSGARDYGSGFAETTPAYGEPLFVADDANGNGRLDPSERLRRLGTSRIRAVLAQVEYTRGSADAPLSEYDLGNNDVGYNAASHATAVAGVLVGGVPGVTHWLGLAPGAELIVADDRAFGDTVGTTGAIQWALDRGANVVLTEYAPYTTTTLDGTSEEELLLDAAVAQNVVAVSPAGNLAVSHKHVHAHWSAGDNAVTVLTDDAFTGAHAIEFSFHVRNDARVPVVTLTPPGGAPLALPESAPAGISAGGFVVYPTSRVSMRGTHERHLVLYRSRGMPAGSYVFNVNVPGRDPLDADVYVGDDVTSWSNGAHFDGNDTDHTLCHPATSDQTLAVAAYVLHGETEYAPWGAAGDRAGYSSRGPRLDGDPGLDIAAPDNPMSLTPVQSGTFPLGSYMPFGGTSGAGPHVAAAAALLRQLFPTETASALRDRLTGHARHNAVATGTNVADMGHGKLDVLAAAGLTDPGGAAPTITLTAPAEVALGTTAHLELVVHDDEVPSALRARWDLDYDGTPDTDWIAIGPEAVDATALGVRGVRVEVRDGQGHIAAATASLDVVTHVDVPDAALDSAAFARPSVNASGGCSCRAGISADSARRGGALGAALVAAVTALGSRRRRRRGRTRRRVAADSPTRRPGESAC